MLVFESPEERDQAWSQFIKDINAEDKQYYAQFVSAEIIYTAFAMFGRKFLTNDEVTQVTLDALGDDEPFAKEDLVNALQRLYDDAIPRP